MSSKQRKDIHGVLLLDKPQGLTSNAALQNVKRLFNARKAGHTGALDPLATGLLPICFGQATKVCEYSLGSDKQYTTVIRLGEVTDTLDAEGEIIERHEVAVSDAEIEAALAQFRGDITQVPPMFSALKRDGQPLYKLARQGKSVEREARPMTVHQLNFNRLSNDTVELSVHCSSGFYIRSLAHDLGKSLGCGAHVIELRRIAIKRLGVIEAISLEQLQSDLDQGNDLGVHLQPIDVLIEHLPSVELSEDQTKRLSNGQSACMDGGNTLELARLYGPQQRLFGIGEINADGQIKTNKIFVGIYD